MTNFQAIPGGKLSAESHFELRPQRRNSLPVPQRLQARRLQFARVGN